MLNENERKYFAKPSRFKEGLNQLSHKIDPNIFSKLNDSYSLTREFIAKDPNAIARLLVGYFLETHYLKYNDKDNFIKHTENVIDYADMEKCQSGMKITSKKIELQNIFKSFCEEIYKEKGKEEYPGDIIYMKMFDNEAIYSLVVLIGRGILRNFFCKSTKELAEFLKRTGLERSKCEGKAINTALSLNSEYDFLEIISEKLKIEFKLLYKGELISFPKNIKYSTELSVFILQAGEFYYILYEDKKLQKVDKQQHILQQQQQNTAYSDEAMSQSLYTRSSPTKPTQINKVSNHLDDYQYTNPNQTGGQINTNYHTGVNSGLAEYSPSTITKNFQKIEGHEGDDNLQAEELNLPYCKCGEIQSDAGYYNARYCKNCKNFTCKLCDSFFNKSNTCNCNRCVCCFKEKAEMNMKVGKKCSDMCHNCYETGDQISQILRRYECGHKVCNLCLMLMGFHSNFSIELNHCVICNH